MRKLTYWVAPVKNDSSSYNMRARTKRELIELVDESGEKAWLRFDKPSKVVVGRVSVNGEHSDSRRPSHYAAVPRILSRNPPLLLCRESFLGTNPLPNRG